MKKIPRDNCRHGNTVDRQGHLVSCEQGGRRVTRTEHNGRIWTSAGEAVSNLVFGGLRYKRMFITASSSLYTVLLSVRGLKTF